MDKPPTEPAQLAQMDQSTAKLTAGPDPYIWLASILIGSHAHEPAVAALNAQMRKQNPAALSGLAAVAITQLATPAERQRFTPGAERDAGG